MKNILLSFGLTLLALQVASQPLNEEQAEHFASLALKCVSKEYPNKPGHVIDDSTDIKSPAELHPAFYGCFDWHSSVHGHWMLVRLLREFPDMPSSGQIRSVLSENITGENILMEKEYFREKSNRSFERTYGWAWLLKLAGELYSWDDPLAGDLYGNLKPLTDLIVSRYYEFLPKLTYPNRTGEHPNTAFGLGFAWDYANLVGIDSLKLLIEKRCREYYLGDRNCPGEYEPGGTDFLSPCLAEADMMARILPEAEFKNWMKYFLPGLEQGEPGSLFHPAEVSDRSDGKLVHLDGLNFSRAWCYYRIANKVPAARALLISAGDAHLAYSLPSVASGEYSGEHWLASFAVYAIYSK